MRLTRSDLFAPPHSGAQSGIRRCSRCATGVAGSDIIRGRSLDEHFFTMTESTLQPLGIAHAFGNRHDRIDEALASRIHAIEADVWFLRGELWVRHAHRLGALPILVDVPSSRASLPWWRRLTVGFDTAPVTLRSVLRRNDRRRPMLLDVKGSYGPTDARAFATALLRSIEDFGAPDQDEVCGQNWKVLDAFRAVTTKVRVRYSIQRKSQWSRFSDRLRTGPMPRSISIHHGLVDSQRASFLRRHGIGAYCWTVDSPGRARELVAEGVEGIISNDLSLLTSLCRPSFAG
jgi:hypothetical protein